MNRGFLYGDGFFESIRVVKSQIPLEYFHMLRIREAMEILRFEPEFELPDDFLSETIKPKELADASVRMNFFREGFGKYEPENNRVAFDFAHQDNTEPFFMPSALDFTSELNKSPEKFGSIGLFDEVKPDHPLYTIKTLSSAYYVLAAIAKKELNLDYMFLQNRNGIILEELNSNVIMFKDGEWFTPPYSSGMLKGATVRYLKAAYGFQLTELEFNFQEMNDADQLYLCKATTGIIRIK